MKPETTARHSPAKPAGRLQSLKHLEGFSISARDGHIGKVHDFFFDDQLWVVRYLVVDTGRWLPGRKVLLMPPMLIGPDVREHSFVVSLTREQIKTSPDVNTDKPVSRIREIELHTHYNVPFHWGGVGPWPGPVPPIAPIEPPPPAGEEDRGDHHLRSVRAMTGFEAQATDGEVGHLEDFIADDKTWRLWYLILNTGGWIAQHKTAVSPDAVDEPGTWSEKRIKLKLTQEETRNLPEWIAADVS